MGELFFLKKRKGRRICTYKTTTHTRTSSVCRVMMSFWGGSSDSICKEKKSLVASLVEQGSRVWEQTSPPVGLQVTKVLSKLSMFAGISVLGWIQGFCS